MVDTQKIKRKDSEHTTTENDQITKEENTRRRKNKRKYKTAKNN